MPKTVVDVDTGCTGIILAGGSSRRMGTDKALLHWGDKNLLENAVLVLQPLCCDLMISSDNPAHDLPGIRRISDKFPGKGPMAGIYSCLKGSRTEDNLVMAVDMPGLTTDILRFLLERGQGYQAAVFLRPEGMPEPLAAYYHKELVGAMAAFMERGDYAMHFLISSVRTLRIKPEEFHLPGMGKLFLNLNEYGEYEKYKPG
jgi:molybdenum cofactor guanylyltransferase